jgi:hypothetical protein
MSTSLTNAYMRGLLGVFLKLTNACFARFWASSSVLLAQCTCCFRAHLGDFDCTLVVGDDWLLATLHQLVTSS